MTTSVSLRSLRPLLAAITLAEEISRDVSARQAKLAPPRLRETLRRQSWQEAAHAAVFRTALHCTPGDSACPQPVANALRRYADRLHADIDRGDLAASMAGLHCVLEGVASIALAPPPGALATLADQLVPLRAFVLHQEEAHQRLGEVWVPRLVEDRRVLTRSVFDYCALAQELVEAGTTHLECLERDADHYTASIRLHLDGTRCRLAMSREDAASSNA